MHVEALGRQIALCSFEAAARLTNLDKGYLNVVSIHSPRVQKCVYWLVEARNNGQKPDALLEAAIARVGIKSGLVAKLTKDALLRNLSIAEKFGCLDAEGKRSGAARLPRSVAGRT